jgi:hypothetical protein
VRTHDYSREPHTKRKDFPMATVTPITREEIQAKLQADEHLVIVEALGPMYFDDAHLPGAQNLPHDQVDELAATVLPDPMPS